MKKKQTLPWKEVGQRIKEAYLAKEMTQNALARAVDASPSTMSAWVRGENPPPSDKMALIIEKTGKPLSYFYPGIGVEEEREFLETNVLNFARMVGLPNASKALAALYLEQKRRKAKRRGR